MILLPDHIPLAFVNALLTKGWIKDAYLLALYQTYQHAARRTDSGVSLGLRKRLQRHLGLAQPLQKRLPCVRLTCYVGVDAVHAWLILSAWRRFLPRQTRFWQACRVTPAQQHRWYRDVDRLLSQIQRSWAVRPERSHPWVRQLHEYAMVLIGLAHTYVEPERHRGFVIACLDEYLSCDCREEVDHFIWHRFHPQWVSATAYLHRLWERSQRQPASDVRPPHGLEALYATYPARWNSAAQQGKQQLKQCLQALTARHDLWFQSLQAWLRKMTRGLSEEYQYVLGLGDGGRWQQTRTRLAHAMAYWDRQWLGRPQAPSVRMRYHQRVWTTALDVCCEADRARVVEELFLPDSQGQLMDEALGRVEICLLNIKALLRWRHQQMVAMVRIKSQHQRGTWLSLARVLLTAAFMLSVGSFSMLAMLRSSSPLSVWGCSVIGLVMLSVLVGSGWLIRHHHADLHAFCEAMCMEHRQACARRSDWVQPSCITQRPRGRVDSDPVPPSSTVELASLSG